MIKVNNLSFKHKNAKDYTLKNISFSVEKGGLAVLFGPNGSGKTTLLKCISGLLDITSGAFY